MRKFATGIAIIAASTLPGIAQASENGGGAYPNGAEALDIAALPPPGTYLLDYANYYTADRLNDADGKSLVPDFRIDAIANIARFVHVTDTKFLGATVAMQAFVPLVDLKVRAGGVRDHKFGLGDMIVNPLVLGWNKGNWHYILTMDTFVPTGRYNKNDLANIGRNYWTFEPLVAISYKNPKGGPEFSAKIMYDFNTRNKATDYSSGQEFHVDASASYNFNPLTVGITGYYYKQTTDDKQAGIRVGNDGFRGEVLALGPVVRTTFGKVPLTFQWQREFMAHNRPQGDKFWIKSVFRF